MKNDEDAIREFVAEWIKASEAGNNEKILSLMADDVVFLTAGQPSMCGKHAFADQQKAMKGLEVKAESNIQEIKVLGDCAYL